MHLSELRELARLYGLQLSYEDATGKRREASRDALTAVLKARIPDGMSFEDALAAKRLDEREPVRVVWDSKSVSHGYHEQDDGSLLICAPRKAFSPERTWGLFVPLYAAHTRDKERGDLGVLRQYLDWVKACGGGMIGTLPLLAAFEDERSPYSPVSRLFWNENYLDLEQLPEYVAAGPSTLEQCAERFQPDAGFEKFAQFSKDYATFRAEREGKHSARYHQYVQYRMAQQMRALAGPELYLDFPIGVNGGGYDVWRYPESFAKAVSVGAPPDAFFTKGQNWGFPPLDPDGMRANGYEYFRAAIRHHASHAGILRLDHVMGLHRLFWIPDGAEPKDGVYVRYRDEELFAIVALESQLHDCAIVGEDLGTVPEYVPRAMKRYGFRRMFVVQYEAKPEDEVLTDPPATCVASVNTHDMPPFAAFWRGLDIDDRVQQDLLDEEGGRKERETRAKLRDAICERLDIHEKDELAVLEGVLTFLAASDAEVVLVNLEDLWLETGPQNVPGVPERSWQQRFRLSLQQARADATVQRLLKAVSGARLATPAPRR